MKKIFVFITIALLLLMQASCGESEKPPRFANENDAAIGLIKDAQPELNDDLMRVVKKSDRHDGAEHHLGYNMLVYNERTHLYLPLIILVFPSSEEGSRSIPKDLRSQPYKHPRYETDIDENSRWITQDEIVVNRNIFNGDIEYW